MGAWGSYAEKSPPPRAAISFLGDPLTEHGAFPNWASLPLHQPSTLPQSILFSRSLVVV